MSFAMHSMETLDETNYDSWSEQIKALLIQQNLWSAISEDKPTKEVEIADWLEKDEKALSTIILNITPKQISYIKNCKSASEAWNALGVSNRSRGLLIKLTLYKKLLNMKMGDADCVHQYVCNFESIVKQLAKTGVELQEELNVIMVLASLPKSYENFILELEKRGDVPKFNELKLKLTEEAERRQSYDQNTQNQKVHTVKERVNKYSCDECEKSFAEIRFLRLHKRNHLPEEEKNKFECEECGKVMFDNSNLKKHIKMVHTAKERMKKYRCDECGKSFTEIPYFRKHKQTHLPNKEKNKFKCEECGKVMSYISNMNRHIRLVHTPKEGIKDHSCDVCGKSFAELQYLRDHKRIYLPKEIKTSKCEASGAL